MRQAIKVEPEIKKSVVRQANEYDLFIYEYVGYLLQKWEDNPNGLDVVKRDYTVRKTRPDPKKRLVKPPLGINVEDIAKLKIFGAKNGLFISDSLNTLMEWDKHDLQLDFDKPVKVEKVK
jgi:hypothetical protein